MDKGFLDSLLSCKEVVFLITEVKKGGCKEGMGVSVHLVSFG